MERIVDWQHFGVYLLRWNFLYVFKENYSILDWTKGKKLKWIFWWKIANAKQFDCEAFDIRSTLDNLSV